MKESAGHGNDPTAVVRLQSDESAHEVVDEDHGHPDVGVHRADVGVARRQPVLGLLVRGVQEGV